MDWNWFFSTVAQAVAALAGIFGAFIIAKLLNNQAAFSRSRSRTRELIRESDRLVDSGKLRLFEWYNERGLAYALHYVEKALMEEEAESPDRYYERFSFPEYLPKADALKAIEKAIPEGQAKRRAAEERKRIGLFAGIELHQAVDPVRARFDSERDAIEEWALAVKSHGRAIEEHVELIETQPEQSRIVRLSLIVILLLFWAGVIYPLSFLPVPSGWSPRLSVGSFFTILFSLRGFILSLTTIVFSGLIVGLYALNGSLRHPQEEIAGLRERIPSPWYSDYLRVRFENGQAL